MKNRYLIIILALLCVINHTVPVAAQNQKLLDSFLYSDDSDLKEKSFRAIIQNQNSFKLLILNELEKYAYDHKITTKVPNALIYIASLIRDKSYLDPLTQIIQFSEYSYDSCIYDCPIVFALTLFECFSDFSVSKNLDSKITPVSDLYNDIKFAEAKSYFENTMINIGSQRMQEIYNETKKLNIDQLVQQASPKTTDYVSRFVAVNLLANRINDDKYLYDLYWLEINEAEDASAQYRSEIYRAILKAEHFKSKK